MMKLTAPGSMQKVCVNIYIYNNNNKFYYYYYYIYIYILMIFTAFSLNNGGSQEENCVTVFEIVESVAV